jgi:LPS-assembly protein
MSVRLARVVRACAVLLLSARLQAQVPAGWGASSDTQARLGENHWRLAGGVAIEQGDTKIYADEIETFVNEDRAVASGNVLISQGQLRIAANRADFNTKTRLGTFYNASGIAVQPRQAQRPRPGAVALPAQTGQDTEVYFYGEVIEKIGPKKYKITNGGFTTCVQPTPRWQLTSKTLVLYLDHYTLMRQSVFSVKGVPMLYTPWLYYPTKKEQRATGILLPAYGSSSLRGQSLHNAFFWAIDRSQDATFMHDYFSKAGQGIGGEYRYNFGALSVGSMSAHLLNGSESTNADGTVSPATRTTEIRGDATAMFAGGVRARGSVNYFSDVTTMQTFNTNIYDASRSMRNFGANVAKAWGLYTLNGTLDRRESFYNTTDSVVSGSWPRVSFARSERPLFGSDVYLSLNGEYAGVLSGTRTTGVAVDGGVTRLDLKPQIRYPFKKWQWFTVNSSFSWRDTYYTRACPPSQSAERCSPTSIVDSGLNRKFFTAIVQAVGPVFTRVFDTPGNGYAEKFKHSIEPSLTVQRTSSIDDFNRIVVTDSTDAIVGGTTQFTYGLTNRFYAKQRTATGAPAYAREIVNVDVQQSYYTDDQASKYDQQYANSLSGVPSKFSPVAIRVRAVPNAEINASFQTEFDTRYRAIRSLSATGMFSQQTWLTSTVTWSKIQQISGKPEESTNITTGHYLNTSTNVRTRDNRYGALYSFNYNVLLGTMLQQRISGFYNAQCCGIAFEYQTYNLGGVSAANSLLEDHRFFISFTLAGLGNFSPFSGALAGTPR